MIMLLACHPIIPKKTAPPHRPNHHVNDGNLIGRKNFHVSHSSHHFSRTSANSVHLTGRSLKTTNYLSTNTVSQSSFYDKILDSIAGLQFVSGNK